MVIRHGLLLSLGCVLSLALATGCGELAGERVAQASGGTEAPALVIFAFDRSTSILDHELAHARDLTRERLRHLNHGDRFVALEILELSLQEEPRRWSQQVPNREFPDREMPRDSVMRARFLQDARDYIVTFTESDGREEMKGTDILSTLHLVAAERVAYPGYRSTLVLFSDMLQANSVMNMEGLVRMPPPNWTRLQVEAGTLPDLRGLCVFVVGAPDDTRAGQTVRGFWEEYFEVTGAVLHASNYAYRPVQIPHRPCPEI
jgi:hypothetical protein